MPSGRRASVEAAWDWVGLDLRRHVPELAEGASTETDHRSRARRIVEKAPAIYGLAGNPIL